MDQKVTSAFYFMIWAQSDAKNNEFELARQITQSATILVQYGKINKVCTFSTSFFYNAIICHIRGSLINSTSKNRYTQNIPSDEYGNSLTHLSKILMDQVRAQINYATAYRSTTLAACLGFASLPHVAQNHTDTAQDGKQQTTLVTTFLSPCYSQQSLLQDGRVHMEDCLVVPTTRYGPTPCAAQPGMQLIIDQSGLLDAPFQKGSLHVKEAETLHAIASGSVNNHCSLINHSRKRLRPYLDWK
jgi:hypothetical protein